MKPSAAAKATARCKTTAVGVLAWFEAPASDGVPSIIDNRP
jgi:hypothetical protein